MPTRHTASACGPQTLDTVLKQPTTSLPRLPSGKGDTAVKLFRSAACGAALIAGLLAVSLAKPVLATHPYPTHPQLPHRLTPAYNHADRKARYYAAQRPWHGPYAYTQWGTPVSLVVPPTAAMHTSLSWGVAQSEMTPIYHQFHRDYPGVVGGPSGRGYGNYPYGYLPTPYWPSHTDQLGVYPIRGPW